MYFRVAVLLVIVAGACPRGFAVVDSPAALKAATACKEESEPSACERAVKLGLSQRNAAETYTFWADAILPGEAADARKLLQKAVQLDPDDALALYMLAGLGDGSDYKSQLEQEQLCHRVIQLRPNWEGPHVLLAGLAGQWDSGRRIAELEQALKLAPDDPGYRAGLESARTARDHLEAELRANEEKARQDPKNWAIQAAYSARFLCDLKNTEVWYGEFQKFFPDDPPIFLAETYAGCGQYEKAIELNRQAVATFEKRLNAGLTYDQAIQLQEQQLQFLDLLPELSRLELVRATLMERAGNWYSAKVYLERAVQAVPNADAYARLVHAILKENPNAAHQAQVAIEAALKLDAQFLEHHPDLKPYYKAETKR